MLIIWTVVTRGQEISLAYDNTKHQQFPLLKRTQYQRNGITENR